VMKCPNNGIDSMRQQTAYETQYASVPATGSSTQSPSADQANWQAYYTYAQQLYDSGLVDQAKEYHAYAQQLYDAEQVNAQSTSTGKAQSQFQTVSHTPAAYQSVAPQTPSVTSSAKSESPSSWETLYEYAQQLYAAGQQAEAQKYWQQAQTLYAREFGQTDTVQPSASATLTEQKRLTASVSPPPVPKPTKPSTPASASASSRTSTSSSAWPSTSGSSWPSSTGSWGTSASTSQTSSAKTAASTSAWPSANTASTAPSAAASTSVSPRANTASTTPSAAASTSAWPSANTASTTPSAATSTSAWPSANTDQTAHKNSVYGYTPSTTSTRSATAGAFGATSSWADDYSDSSFDAVPKKRRTRSSRGIKFWAFVSAAATLFIFLFGYIGLHSVYEGQQLHPDRAKNAILQPMVRALTPTFKKTDQLSAAMQPLLFELNIRRTRPQNYLTETEIEKLQNALETPAVNASAPAVNIDNVKAAAAAEPLPPTPAAEAVTPSADTPTAEATSPDVATDAGDAQSADTPAENIGATGNDAQNKTETAGSTEPAAAEEAPSALPTRQPAPPAPVVSKPVRHSASSTSRSSRSASDRRRDRGEKSHSRSRSNHRVSQQRNSNQSSQPRPKKKKRSISTDPLAGINLDSL
jgi:hypothetical protein